MSKPIKLTSITFSDETGNMILIDHCETTFASHDDAERHIQARYVYWKETLNKKLFIAPSMNETLEEIEVKKVFQLTAEHLNLAYKDMMSTSRKAKLVEGRRIATNICYNKGVRQCTIEIASGLDHSTIDHHRKMWANYMEIDSDYAFRYLSAEDYVLTKINQ